MVLYTLEEIKNVLSGDYCFHAAKTIDEIKQILESDDMPFDNVPFVLEVGNLDIEITIYADDDHDHLFLGYYCCVRKDGEWESYDEIDTEVNLDTPDLEAEMFRVLSEYADKHNLSFFSQNHELPDTISVQNENEADLER